MPVQHSPKNAEAPGNRQQVFEHRDPGAKDTWVVKIANPEARVLVIGDSNMHFAAQPSVPSDWEIHALVGAKFWHVRDVLKKVVISDKLKVIIITAGISHREPRRKHMPRSSATSTAN